MANNIPRKAPTGRYLEGFADGAVLALGYAEAAGPIAVDDATRIVLVSAVPVWPTGLLPAAARLGVFGHATVSQSSVDAEVGRADMGVFFSGLANTNQRADDSVRPLPDDPNDAQIVIASSFLSAVGDAALAVGMTVSLQARNEDEAVPPHTYRTIRLWWLLLGAP